MFYGGMAVDKNNNKTEEEKKVSVSLRENEAYIRGNGVKTAEIL